jgi:hypothetical protein
LLNDNMTVCCTPFMNSINSADSPAAPVLFIFEDNFSTHWTRADWKIDCHRTWNDPQNLLGRMWCTCSNELRRIPKPDMSKHITMSGQTKLQTGQDASFGYANKTEFWNLRLMYMFGIYRQAEKQITYLNFNNMIVVFAAWSSYQVGFLCAYPL